MYKFEQIFQYLCGMIEYIKNKVFNSYNYESLKNLKKKIYHFLCIFPWCQTLLQAIYNIILLNLWEF